MFAAAMYADPDSLETIKQAREQWIQRNLELDEQMYHVYDALLTGEPHPSIVGTEIGVGTLKSRELFSEITTMDKDIVEELRQMLRGLHEQGRVDEFSRQLNDMSRNHSGISHSLNHAINGCVNFHRNQRELISAETIEPGLTKHPNAESVITAARALAGDQAANAELSRALEVVRA